MRSPLLVTSAILATGLILAACGGQVPTAMVAPTTTPNPCSPQNIKSTAGAINALMQQFDDESALASNVPLSQLAEHIANLQSIRRQAQDLAPPPCVATLKELQLAHMNTVVDTLLAFLSHGDQNAVSRGIEAGRNQHAAYEAELARLMAGATAGGAPIEAASTPIAQGEAGASATRVAAGLSAFVVVNPGPVPLTLRATPSTAGDQVATLPVGNSAVALGGSSDGQWIQVIVPARPYETAWVMASLVQITVPTAVPTP